MPLKKVSEVRATRWTIEEDIQLAKGEFGLDEYDRNRKAAAAHRKRRLAELRRRGV
jgi:hypothetical protein